MHVNNNQLGLIVVSLLGIACGPEAKDANDWMLGVFSNVVVGDMSLNLSGVTHYEFKDDGRLLIGGVSECGKNIKSDDDEYRWEQTGSDTILVELPESGSGIDAWQIRTLDDCNAVIIEELREGTVIDGYSLTRGAVCLSDDLPPCEQGTSCESCKSVWCDEAPPECE